MSRPKKKELNEQLAEQLIDLMRQARAAQDARERDSIWKAATVTADRLSRSGLGVNTIEHAKRVRNSVASVHESLKRTGRVSEKRLDEITTDATSLLEAVNRTGRPVTDLELSISHEPRDIAEKIIEFVRDARADTRNRVREHLHGQVRQAVDLLLREADYLDFDTQDIAAAVRENVARATLCGYRGDKDGAADGYLQQAEEDACALRDAIRDHPGPDARPRRRRL